MSERHTSCRHCDRTIVNEGGRWIDPEATGDDSVWRETCDAHDTFTAEHEPEPVGEDGRTHFVGDGCLAQHYESEQVPGLLFCGEDFMAGTICSERAGHEGPHGTPCPVCGGDWMNGTCTCPPDDEDLPRCPLCENPIADGDPVKHIPHDGDVVDVHEDCEFRSRR